MFVFSPDVILCGWLGAKRQLTNCSSCRKSWWNIWLVTCYFFKLSFRAKTLLWSHHTQTQTHTHTHTHKSVSVAMLCLCQENICYIFTHCMYTRSGSCGRERCDWMRPDIWDCSTIYLIFGCAQHWCCAYCCIHIYDLELCQISSLMLSVFQVHHLCHTSTWQMIRGGR